MARSTQSISITGAQVSRVEDQRARTRRYLFSMAIRTVCFLGAILASGWLRWTLVAGAVLLPYIAVVMANAGRKPAPKASPMIILNDQREIGPNRHE